MKESMRIIRLSELRKSPTLSIFDDYYQSGNVYFTYQDWIDIVPSGVVQDLLKSYTIAYSNRLAKSLKDVIRSFNWAATVNPRYWEKVDIRCEKYWKDLRPLSDKSILVVSDYENKLFEYYYNLRTIPIDEL